MLNTSPLDDPAVVPFKFTLEAFAVILMVVPAAIAKAGPAPEL